MALMDTYAIFIAFPMNLLQVAYNRKMHSTYFVSGHLTFKSFNKVKNELSVCYFQYAYGSLGWTEINKMHNLKFLETKHLAF